MGIMTQLRADLATYDGDWGRQGFWVMVIYRFGRWRYTIKWPLLRKPMSLLYKILYKFVQIITGVELPCEVNVGSNFRIDHFGGIIVSGYARFGSDCIIRNGVTIGLKNIEEEKAPHIGNGVNIGAGAKLLGPITIGDNVDVGANAVVLQSIPDDCIAVGVPARILPKKEIKHENSREKEFPRVIRRAA